MAGFIEFPWGKESLKVSVPDKWRILGELKPKSVPAIADPASACAEALSDPIGASRLSQRALSGKRVVVVVDDHSRPTPVAEFLQPVMDELLAAGGSAEKMHILIATGVHRQSRPDEVEKKIGRALMDAYPWRCHDALDPEGLREIGTTSRGTKVILNRLLTEADLIVCVGAIEPHLLLGFGGGLKMLIPGCAAAETIGKNHMQGVDPDNFDYVGTGGDRSPMRQDLEEGANLLQKDVFIVNVAMNEQARAAAFFCGDPIQAQRQGEKFVLEISRLEVPEQADVVIANSFPMDADLRQSVKCMGNSLYACKPGGVLLGFARSIHGLGEMPLAKKTLPYPVMRTLLKVLGKNRVLSLVEKAKKGEPVEEVFVGHFGLQMLRRNHLGIFSDSQHLPENIGRKMGLARSFHKTESIMDWAASKAPTGATVWAFPSGGSTFASFENGR
jgi:lactate racemase